MKINLVTLLCKFVHTLFHIRNHYHATQEREDDFDGAGALTSVVIHDQSKWIARRVQTCPIDKDDDEDVMTITCAKKGQ